MAFKDFFTKQIVPGFFVTVTCITFAMAVLGTAYGPDVRLSYGILFSPFIYGSAATATQLINYSAKELTIKQALIRKVFQVLALEIVVMGIAYGAGALTGTGVTVALALAILLIYGTVTLIMWISDKRSSDAVNRALLILQKERSE
jgi:uncharacterized membrane protein